VTDLEKIFNTQADLQRVLGSYPGANIGDEERIQFLKDMLLAAEDELHEALGEIGWKPWATSRHINREAFKSELVDTFQFFMNLCFGVGLTPHELAKLHEAKVEKNIQRHVIGYDGVSTKCPMCKRALDDDSVSCEPIGQVTKMTGYCHKIRERDPGSDGLYTREDIR
jgi:hypothetical protein